MRRLIGLALAALLVSFGMACGGGSSSSAPARVDVGGGGLDDGGGGLGGGDDVLPPGDTGGEDPGDGGDGGDQCGPPENGDGPRVCLACKATGGGTFYLGDTRVTFGLNALPAKDGAGFGDVGIAAKGHIELHLHARGGGDNIFGRVDTIITCEELEDGTASATFAGELRDGGRFEVTVTDAGEPGRPDTISFTNDVSFGPQALEEGGNLQVRGFDRCVNECPPDMCWCPEAEMCVPCPPPPPPPPPQCDEGLCWCPETETCEPCYTPTLPPPPPYEPL